MSHRSVYHSASRPLVHYTYISIVHNDYVAQDSASRPLVVHHYCVDSFSKQSATKPLKQPEARTVPASLVLFLYILARSLPPAPRGRMKSSRRVSATRRLSATARRVSELCNGIQEIDSKCTVRETQYHEDDGSSIGSSNKRSSWDNASTSEYPSNSDHERLAQRGNVAVKCSKCLVYFVLVLVATGAGYSTFHFLDQEEKKDFEVQVS
jgi:hypothetical protein